MAITHTMKTTTSTDRRSDRVISRRRGTARERSRSTRPDSTS